MKTHLFALAALLALAPLQAASKKSAKDPALAETWTADIKAYEGKKITTYVVGIGDIGQVSSDAEYAVLSVTTGTSSGKAGEEIPVLVPPAKINGLMSSLEPKRSGKSGVFGSKITYAPLTATFITLQGQPALVYGDVTEAAKKTNLAALFAAQHPAQSSSPKKSATTGSGVFGKHSEEPRSDPTAPKKPVR